MSKHECCNCDYMKELQDENCRIFYFCMFSQSPCFLEETGLCGECELDGYAEDLYEEGAE